MIRALLTWWTGRPRCDQGTAFGRAGCWRTAVGQTKPPVPKAWIRPLRWCAIHGGDDPSECVPLSARRAGLR